MDSLRNPQYDGVKILALVAVIIFCAVFVYNHIARRSQVNQALVGDITPPTAPSNLSLVSKDPSSATLSWDASTDDDVIENYTVYEITGETENPDPGGAIINISTSSSTPVAKDLFGVAVNDYGENYTDYSTNPVWNTMIGEVGFTSGAYTAGAEDRWIHPYSAKGGYNNSSLDPIGTNLPLTVLPKVVGMGANIDEIYHYTGSQEGAYKLQTSNNETNVDFWDVTADYIKSHNQKMVFSANIVHGTTDEMATFINSISAHGIGSYKLRYGLELSSGIGGNLTSGEYIAAASEYDSYLTSHYSSLPPRVVSMADHTTCKNQTQTECWDNDDVYQWAVSRGIEEFSQYMWLDAFPSLSTTAPKNIDDYFAQSNQLLRADLDSVLGRLASYQHDMPNLKFHLAQYGMNLQRSGYGTQTMLHGIMTWNFLFEILKFNSTHNNYVSSAIFLENESAVNPYGAGDSSFVIDSSYVDGGKSFVKRVPGVAYEMLKPIFTSPNPLFVDTDITSGEDGFGAISVKTDKTRLYVYNNGPERMISGIMLNGAPVTGSHYRNALWSEKLYGSIGTSPAHSHFKGDNYIESNPNYQAVSAQAEKGNIDLGDAIMIRPNSITVIDLE